MQQKDACQVSISLQEGLQLLQLKACSLLDQLLLAWKLLQVLLIFGHLILTMPITSPNLMRLQSSLCQLKFHIGIEIPIP